MSARSLNIQEFVKFGRKIVAVGRNYRDHCAELNNPIPTTPLLFMKPPSAYLQEGEGSILIPRGCQSLHHEVELGVIIRHKCRDISEKEALSCVGGYALALDMTARDFQEEVNNKDRQRGCTDQMVFGIPELLSYISGIFTLHPGDLILTGTPAGVGPVTAGDCISCGIDVHNSNLVQFSFNVEQRV